jgi:enoyl-CoA hydratase
MSQPLILTVKHDGICRVTLNRPEALNALSTGLRSELTRTFRDLAADPDTEVVILTGAGRAFTVGLDLKELGGEISPSDDPSRAAASTDVAEAMADLDRPIIGAINGFAITGGFEIALMCDFLIASTEAKFADTHARVGVVPGWGLSQRLPRLIGINRAKELSLTGNFLEATTALEWGLVNRVVEPADLLPVAELLARDIVSTDRATRSEILRIMDEGWAGSLAEGLRIEKEANVDHGRREVRAERIAARRADIQDRGRDQSRT